MKKKNLIIITIVTIFTLALFAGLFFQQSKYGVKLNNLSYLICDVEQLELDDYIENCSDINNQDFIFLRNENRFPSKNATDYKKIIIYANVKNMSLFEYTLYDSYISDSNDDSIVCFAITNTAGDTIDLMSKEEYVPLITLFVYIGESGITDIENNMDNFVIDTYFYNKLFKNIKYTYCFSDETIELLSKNPYE